MKMATDPRDIAVERLLREQRDANGSSVRGVCLDVETLAAWMDEALGHDERAAAELHVADCARCQALLAAMARTAPAASESRAWWRRPALAWAVPLTAAATALVVWIATPGVRKQPASVVSVADSTAPATAAPERVPPSAFRDELKTAPVEKEVPAPAAKKALQSQDKLARGQLGKAEADSRGAQTEEERLARGRRADAQSQLEAKADALRQKAAGNEVAAAPSTAAGASPTVAGASPGPVAGASPAPAAGAPRAPGTPPAAAAVAPAEAAAKLMAARAAPIVEIVSSNPGSRWRILGGRMVQRSMDGGATWQDQTIGVNVALTAGSSPTPSVCWLIGPGGMVLVTADGRAWRRVAFPEAVDLIAIRAADAESATVTTADGRTFTTTDGGASWGRTGV
jgi:hypothetical protein